MEFIHNIYICMYVYIYICTVYIDMYSNRYIYCKEDLFKQSLIQSPSVFKVKFDIDTTHTHTHVHTHTLAHTHVHTHTHTHI